MRYFLLALLLVINSVYAADKVFTPEQEARIQALIRQTLIANPDILAQAAQEWEKQNNEHLLSMHRQALYDDPNSPRFGPKDAKLTLVLFTDYNCPFCKRFDPLLQEVLKKHPDVALIIKMLPYKGESSVKAARLALTTWRQHPDKFLSLHQQLMNKRTAHNDASIDQAQKDAQLMDVKPDEQSNDTIRQDLQLAEQLGVQGTPATLVGDQMLPGAVDYATLENLVKQQLAKQ